MRVDHNIVCMRHAFHLTSLKSFNLKIKLVILI